MPKYFGTDGIRAIAGEFPLTEDFVSKLGYCAIAEINKRGLTKSRASTVLIAEDSRISGPQLSQYLTRGILAAGFDVLHIGVAPTPAVAYLVQKKNAACGIVISASHNPAEFNGIKFFSPDGRKFSEELEAVIETAVENTKQIPPQQPNTKLIEDASPVKEYTDLLKSTVPAGINFKGIKIVLDCANGASCQTAPRIFKDLGADIIVINDKPTGLNINDKAGALHIQGMQKVVLDNNAFIGFSFDGDADRLIAADEQGREFDGDNIISAAAVYLKEQGKLKQNKVVLTVMANLGLINFLKQNNIEPLLTAVGDKYVCEAMEKENLSLGGETSGHIIWRDIAPMGDGTLCALQLLSVIIQSGKKPSWFKNLWSKYPLKLVPVKVSQKVPLEQIEGFCELTKSLEKQMNGKGRIFVRYSGTEPLLRILVEGEDKDKVEQFAAQVAQYYKSKVK